MVKKLIWVVGLAVVAYLGYAVWYTLKVNPEKGLVVCVPAGQQKTFSYTAESGEKIEDTVSGSSNESCFWSAHIHAVMDLTYCGQQFDLAKDKGDLRGPHTHKEKNEMHAPHSPQPVDSKTNEFINPTPLTVGGFLDAMDIDTKTPCPGSKNSVATVTINNQQKTLDYIWQDEDQIKIIYQ